ncbi:carbohydrate ABC transporter permease [Pseudarthrobacter sp. alpha12b]
MTETTTIERATASPPSGSLRSGRKRTSLGQAGRPGLVWAAPAVLFFTVFALVPLAFAVYLSFTYYNGIRLSSPKWVGLDNWVRLFQDPQAASSLGITLALVGIAVATQTPLSLLIGVWAAGPQRGRAVVLSIFFIPLLMSTAAVSVLWSSLIDPNFGLPAAMPWLFGDGNLLGHQWSAIAVIAVIYLWGATPLHTLIYQGAARAIPPALYQAAQIDGAGRVRQFFAITLPLLKNTIVTDVILIVVGTFTTFDLILILTGGGPSQGTAILPYYMYEQGFSSFDLGYGSVIAMTLVVLCATISIVMTKVTGFDKMSGTQEGI